MKNNHVDKYHISQVVQCHWDDWNDKENIKISLNINPNMSTCQSFSILPVLIKKKPPSRSISKILQYTYNSATLFNGEIKYDPCSPSSLPEWKPIQKVIFQRLPSKDELPMIMTNH